MSVSIGSQRVLLHTAENGWTVEPAILKLDGPVISAIEKHPHAEQISKTTHWLSDDLITPGFVDSHTHLALSFIRGQVNVSQAEGNLVEDLFFKLEEKITPADVASFSRMGAYECLLSGTTFVWDHYYHADAVAEAMIEVGLTGTVAPTLQDLSGPGKNNWEQSLSLTKELSRSERHKAHGIWAALGPHATDTVSENLWRKILDLAEQYNIPIHSHVAQSPEEFSRIFDQFSCTPIDFLRRVGLFDSNVEKQLVHVIYASQTDLSHCKADNVHLIACPHSQLIFHFPAAYMEWWRSGIHWGVGTDCAASNDSLRVQAEMRTLATWPMAILSSSPEFSEFRKSATPNHAHSLSVLRQTLAAESKDVLPENKILNALFLGSDAGPSPQRPMVGFSTGALANLAVWNWQDPVFWPGVAPRRAMIFSDVQTALKGIMTLGRWRGTVGDVRRSILSSSEYKMARRESTERLHHLIVRAGL